LVSDGKIDSNEFSASCGKTALALLFIAFRLFKAIEGPGSNAM
jgi:hypothetical protein